MTVVPWALRGWHLARQVYATKKATNMTKYSSEERHKAEVEIRDLLRQGLRYHQAAQRLSEHSVISVFTLRHMAYRIAVREGFFTPSGSQHSSDTEHGRLIQGAKLKLEDAGYRILEEQNEIRAFVEARGSKGNPDLVAVKGSEVLLVEAVERAKGTATLIDQVERFAKVGKVILVFPVNTANVALWGLQDLVGS